MNAGWWFGTMEFWMTFQKQLGISSSQLTNSIIFQRDWSHQPDKNSYKLCLGQCWNLLLVLIIRIWLLYGRIVAWGWPVSTLLVLGDPRSVKLPRLLFREKCQIEWFQKNTGWICWISSKSTILATSFPVPQMVFACFRYHASGSLDSFGSARDMVVRMETTDRELQVLHVRIYVPSGLSAYYTMIIIYIYNHIYTYIHTYF